MGCFLACFGSFKDKNRRNQQQRYRVQHREQRHTSFEPVQSAVPVWEKPVSPELKDIKPINSELKDERPISPELEGEKPISLELKDEKPSSPESEDVRDKPVEQLSLITRKKVTFDSNVQTYEHVAINESTDGLCNCKECQKEGKTLKESSQSKTSEDGSVTSSSGSYPPNHRYQNCRDSDDEDEPLDYDEDSNLDDDDDLEDDMDDDGELEYEGEIVDSKKGTQVLTEDANTPMPEKTTGLNYSARDRSGYVHAVLNPVENLTQWKAVKAKKRTVTKPQKENFTLDEEPRMSFSSEPCIKEVSSTFKSCKRQSGQARNSNQEMAVDASLSNWLGSSESIPANKTSTISLDASTPEKSMSYGSPHSATSLEDRPILGALTVEELRQFSASSSPSPRKSPSRSPDEMAIIGTVGSYWNDHTGRAKGSGASSYKGIPNTTSKYREDRRVNWHSTPFETRLERALNRGAADAYSSSRTPHGL
ncbi:eisosome protein SEG2 [Argentina anserina]|uniref:eisosome protein SEG2 n=1 Tax=Argentina anserina TaxID=57926 RepID=UPI0021768C1E|nr:eisosome protein SEG2 [Potentilla anserina]